MHNDIIMTVWHWSVKQVGSSPPPSSVKLAFLVQVVPLHSSTWDSVALHSYAKFQFENPRPTRANLRPQQPLCIAPDRSIPSWDEHEKDRTNQWKRQVEAASWNKREQFLFCCLLLPGRATPDFAFQPSLQKSWRMKGTKVEMPQDVHKNCWKLRWYKNDSLLFLVRFKGFFFFGYSHGLRAVVRVLLTTEFRSQTELCEQNLGTK